MKYAGFFKRFIAFIVDIIIIVFACSFFIIFFGLIFSFNIQSSLVVNFGCFMFCVLYCALFDSSKYQATPGKMLLGMRIVNFEGERISFRAACLRSFIKNVSSIFPPIYIVCAFTDKKQNLHDSAAGSYVIDNGSSDPQKSGKSVRIAIVVVGLFILGSFAIAAVTIKAVINSGINYESLMAENAVNNGMDISALQFSEKYFENIELSIAAPFNLKRNEEKENSLKNDGLLNIDDIICYGFYSTTPFSLEIQYITYSSEVSLREVFEKQGLRNLSAGKSENAEEFVAEKFEFSGREALKNVRYERKNLEGAAGKILQQSAEKLNNTFFGKFDIIIIIRDTPEKAWFIHASTGQERKFPLLEKVMDSVKIAK